ncbi:hypothetical protein K0B96_12945 [Horticoccus luteus]|uniref:Uncharacterized protein n=1 Tax=Horticoccus luteus TaxID=2862869 RepID=A0A8F9XFK7_9BACT|nr:hypothetical protein [Horticoccus luteus]QYM78202.1 hypothetical protein K0B96_12945 [Horticoccus luteus]
MKRIIQKNTLVRCRWRGLTAAAVGLGIGWAISKSLGVAMGCAIGTGVTAAMLAAGRNEENQARRP